MSFVEKNLRKNESIKMKAENSTIHVVVRSVVAVTVFMLCADNDLILLGLILAIFLLAKPVITILTTELAVTNTRVVGKVGLFFTKTMDSPLNKIQNCSVEQDILGKIFGYSKIRISSASGDFLFQDINKGEKFKQQLMEAIELYDEERIKKQAKTIAAAMNNQQ